MLTTSLESGSPTYSFLAFFLIKSSSGLLIAQSGPNSLSPVCAEDLGVQILWEISLGHCSCESLEALYNPRP